MLVFDLNAEDAEAFIEAFRAATDLSRLPRS